MSKESDVVATVLQIAADISAYQMSGCEAAKMILRDYGVTKKEAKKELSDGRLERILELIKK